MENISRILQSESGRFLIDRNGKLIRFIPTPTAYVREESRESENYEFFTSATIRNLIIPEGVRSFPSYFLRGIKVTGALIFPKTLDSIGTTTGGIYIGEIEGESVFANCILPKVVIPDNVKELGDFAFGHTYIEELVLPTSIRSRYSRQFKDSYIKKLYMPEDYREIPANEKFGWLHWPSTRVDETVYYR